MSEKDPVCGMEVTVKNETPKSNHSGHTYFFCSTSCKKKFDAEPARYAHVAGGKTGTA